MQNILPLASSSVASVSCLLTAAMINTMMNPRVCKEIWNGAAPVVCSNILIHVDNNLHETNGP